MNTKHDQADISCEFWQAGCCQLLQKLTGVAEKELCSVDRSACRACLRGFPPSTDDINPVVASLLHQLTSAIVDRNGVEGCGRQKALELNQWAEENIPVLPADEDDIEAPAPQTILAKPRSREERIESLLPFPKQRRGPTIRNWAVGVTTAPRRLETLSHCVASLAQSGWPTPHLFVDSPVPIPENCSGLPITVRNPKTGAFPNYYLSLAELLLGNPGADAYLMVQDDVLFYNHPGLREYLEQALWPGDQPGPVSLFCSRFYTQPQPGWSRLDAAWVWGAQAFVFPREIAQAFIADRDVLMHRWNPRFQGLANIDSLLGQWAHRRGSPIYFPTPSLVQHIGHVSTLWRTSRVAGGRRAEQFAGEPSS